MRKSIAIVLLLTTALMPLSGAFAKQRAHGHRKAATHVKHGKVAKKGKPAKHSKIAKVKAVKKGKSGKVAARRVKDPGSRKPASAHSRKSAHVKKTKAKKHARKH